jgi:hypothetical protein
MKSILRISTIAFLLGLLTQLLTAQQASNPWSKWDYLIGDWVGDGKGEPGEARGGFSIKTDLDKNILVRTNHVEVTATKDRPSGVHDDLMIVYSENKGTSAKAIYFDNEKHVINYIVTYDDRENAIILTSEIKAGSPRFRFTYKKIDDRKISIYFDIAPAGKPEAFSKYIEGTAHRK